MDFIYDIPVSTSISIKVYLTIKKNICCSECSESVDTYFNRENRSSIEN